MGLFRKKKKRDFVDLTERYKKQQEKLAQMGEESKTAQEEGLSFLGSLADSVTSRDDQVADSGYVDISGAEEKRKKLTNRLMNMTEKLEELSNQIYHLQQRIEVLEQKMRVGSFE